MHPLLFSYRLAGLNTNEEVLAAARCRGIPAWIDALHAIQEDVKPNSIAMVVVKAEPPGKNVTSLIRSLVKDRTKLIVVAQPGKLAPGNFEKLLRASAPDIENKLRVMDSGESLSDAIESAERNRHYRPGQALEVFCDDQLARNFSQEISDGSLGLDPTVIMVHPIETPSDDIDDLLSAVADDDLASMHRMLDPHVFSNQGSLGDYKRALFGGEKTNTKESVMLEANVLPPQSEWPPADILVGIAGGSPSSHGIKFSRHAKIPPEVVVPAGITLFHGTSSQQDFGIPRGPASFALSKKIAQLYADHEGEGVSPRVKSFVTTRAIRCIDHPGAGKYADEAAFWMDRWANEVVGHKGTKEWGMIGYARQVDKLKIIKDAGYDGLVIRSLDSGGVEVAIFEPDNFVSIVENESLRLFENAQLHCEFLTDIAASRELGVDKLDSILRHELGDSYADMEYLGSGRNGSAYEAPDGLIIKITTDKVEADSAKRLCGERCSYIHDIHSVSQTTHPGVWVILQEGGLEKLPSQYAEEFDLAMEILETIGAGHALRMGDAKGVLEVMIKSGHHDLCHLVAEVIERFNIGGMLREIAELGLSADFHSGNIMLREGCPVLTDLGTHGDDPGDLTEMASFSADSVLSRLKDMEVVPPGTTGEIGEGHWGMVFPSIDPGAVVKVTEHDDEARNAKRLVGKSVPGIVKVFNVMQLNPSQSDRSSKKLWLIKLEHLKPLDIKIYNAISDVESDMTAMYLNSGAKNYGEFLKSSKADQVWSNVHSDIGLIIKSAQSLGFSPDIRADNLMMNNAGKIVLADLGPLSGNTFEGHRLNRQVSELAGTPASSPGPLQMRGSNSSAWAGGRLVLSKPEQHVPEDENETERDRALDQDIIGGGLDWGPAAGKRSF